MNTLGVLMYHSISSGSGPTCIPPETFRKQIDALTGDGYEAISLPTFRAWHAGELDLPERSVLITFDDGFTDFPEYACPILKEAGFAATVFLITGRMGQSESWGPVGTNGTRHLMSWEQAGGLISEGFDVGGHSVAHRDLTRLSTEELRQEIRQCREDIEDRLGYPPLGFAAPYGKAGQRERDEISRHFGLAMGTRLDRVCRNSDPFDLPRIEMHYFRDIDRWRAFLDGGAGLFMASRQVIRRVRAMWA